MPFLRPDLVIPLEKARHIIDQPSLDVKAALNLLQALPDDIGNDARMSVDKAMRLIADASKGGSHGTVARYALARVIVMLEQAGSTEPRP